MLVSGVHSLCLHKISLQLQHLHVCCFVILTILKAWRGGGKEGGGRGRTGGGRRGGGRREISRVRRKRVMFSVRWHVK